jgi:DNA-binding NarL/FixJ family response regulator
VRPLGLHYSLGFNLYDCDGALRTMFMLDRTTQVPFSEQELDALSLAVPQLNNLHKNFFSNGRRERVVKDLSWDAADLTEREIQIATLLCYGLKPAKISEKLHISQATVYKHIANIYKKMQVTSRQELLVRLLNH